MNEPKSGHYSDQDWITAGCPEEPPANEQCVDDGGTCGLGGHCKACPAIGQQDRPRRGLVECDACPRSGGCVGVCMKTLLGKEDVDGN